MKKWRDKAERMFFESRMKIVDIAAELNIARETVGKYLKDCKGFKDEMNRRKDENAEKRVEYKARWECLNRACLAVTGDSLRREHETAARILSAEKY